MGLSAPSKLYFAAALLFLSAVAIGLFASGFELKAIIGLAMTGLMVALGLKAHKGSAI
jgi:hypothetical protein